MNKLYSFLLVMGCMLFTAACSDDDPVENGKPDNPEPDPTEVVDLSVNGTANSYIVNKGGVYSLDATVMGNGVSTKGATAMKLNPASVDLLWQDVTGLISDLNLENGKVIFKVSGNEGNAIIAIKDAAGKVLWNWHIWSTIYSPEIEYQTMNGVNWMNRNLGATTAQWDEKGKVKGLFYQWGRKDPFPALAGWDDNGTLSDIYDIEGKKIAPFTTGVVEADMNLDNAIQNPTLYYGGVRGEDGKGPYDWYTSTDYFKQNDYLWETEAEKAKTMFDPCPPGWRVPKSSAFYGLNNNNFAVSNTDNGRVHESIGYFPATGLRGFEGGIWTSVGYFGDYWTSTADTEGRVRTLHFIENSVNPRGRNYRAAGMPVRCVSEAQSGEVPEPGTEYDIDIQADRYVADAAGYKANDGVDGSANYYIALANVSVTLADLNGMQQFVPEKNGELIFLDLYGKNSEDENFAIIPEGKYELGSVMNEGIATTDYTLSRYLSDDGQSVIHRKYKTGHIDVTHIDAFKRIYKIEAELTSVNEEKVHVIYEGELVLTNRGESSIKTVIVNPVNATFHTADAIYHHTSKAEGYDRYSVNLYEGVMNGNVLTNGYCMHVDLFSEALSTKENMQIKEGLYTITTEADFSPGHFQKGRMASLLGVPIYIGTYCQEVRPTNEAVLYGFAVKGTIEVKRKDAQYEFIVDVVTPEGVAIKGVYPMGDVTFIDQSPELPGGDWNSLLKEDKTLEFKPTDEVWVGCYDYGAYTYANSTEYEIIVNNHTSNESFYLHFLTKADATSPAGTYTVAKDPQNPQPGEFLPGYAEFEVLKDTWCYVKWVDGGEAGGAPATEGTLTITDNGNNNYTIEYEMKDDAQPKNTVKATWTGEMKITVRAE